MFFCLKRKTDFQRVSEGAKPPLGYKSLGVQVPWWFNKGLGVLVVQKRNRSLSGLYALCAETNTRTEQGRDKYKRKSNIRYCILSATLSSIKQAKYTYLISLHPSPHYDDIAFGAVDACGPREAAPLFEARAFKQSHGRLIDRKYISDHPFHAR